MHVLFVGTSTARFAPKFERHPINGASGRLSFEEGAFWVASLFYRVCFGRPSVDC